MVKEGYFMSENEYNYSSRIDLLQIINDDEDRARIGKDDEKGRELRGGKQRIMGGREIRVPPKGMT